MTTTEKTAVAKVRAALKIARLDPRRLYIVDDSAYRWIGDRAELNAKDARYLKALNRYATRPDLGKPAVLDEEEDEHYSDVCGRVGCVAASHGSAGVVDFDDLPESWRDGSALGPIAPL